MLISDWSSDVCSSDHRQVTMAPGHALVTGGASGIGLAIAEALADAGWAVTLLGRSPEWLAAAKASRDSFETVSCDVGDAEGVAAALAGAAEARGPGSLLVNCAGDRKRVV